VEETDSFGQISMDVVTSVSQLVDIPMAPPDPILGVSEASKSDTRIQVRDSDPGMPIDNNIFSIGYAYNKNNDESRNKERSTEIEGNIKKMLKSTSLHSFTNLNSLDFEYSREPLLKTMETLVVSFPRGSQHLTSEDKSNEIKRPAPSTDGCRVDGYVHVTKVHVAFG